MLYFKLFLLLVSFRAEATATDLSDEIERKIIRVLDSQSSKEYSGTSFLNSQNKICIYIEEAIESLQTKSQLFLSCETQPGSGIFSSKVVLQDIPSTTLIFNLNALTLSNSRNYLYFTKIDWESQNPSAGWHQWPIDLNGELLDKKPSALKTSEDLRGQSRPWAYPFQLMDKSVLWFYEVWDFELQMSLLKFSIGDKSGLRFSKPRELVSSAQLTRFNQFSNGSWAFGFQVGYGGEMMDYITISPDQGHTFMPPFPITQRHNVHDLFLFRRKDGLLDIYYIVGGPYGFSLYRRKVNSKGILGKEERLTRHFNVQKPKALRLPDGRIWVHFAIVSGSFEESGHYGFIMDHDSQEGIDSFKWSSEKIKYHH